MGKNVETSIVVNATLFWPNLTTKNDMSGKYQVDLGLLDDKTITQIESLGVVVKTDPWKNEDYENRQRYITAKSAKFPIKTFFASDIDETDVGVIGNGSEAMVKLNGYSWKFQGKEGRGLGISKVKITKLNKYEKPDDGEDWGEEAESAPFATDEFED
jgi:hypothetical protein